jgi:hypothetical protein
MKGWNMYKAIFVGLVLLVLYVAASRPSVYLKLWFVVLWSTVAVVTVVRLEVKDWLGGISELRLPPGVQLLLAFVLVLGAALATEWRSLGIRALTPWAYAVFALPSYRQGYMWAWSRLQLKHKA